MKSSFIISVIVMVAMIELVVVQAGEAAITCGEVDSSLAPCIPYLTRGGEPGTDCCNGVKSIQGMAKTTVDKRQVCSCLKEAANRYLNLKDVAAQALPVKCGVQMDIPVSRNINCQIIN